MTTLDINREDTVSCLRRFGITEPVREWKLLADGPDHAVPYDVIRKIIFAGLEGGKKYVVKFVREPVFPTGIIENQCAFSDLLRDRGLETPGRLTRDGRYCVSFEKDGLVMDVYAEEWVGEKVGHLTAELYGSIGTALGRIHRASLETGFQIGFSLLYNEITQRDTSFGRLWKNGNERLIPETAYAEMLAIYNRRLDSVKRFWPGLPRGAVQGDIYSCNNIALRDGRLVIYDFNLAGDEVLIGDILQCWFRTIFDEKIEEDLRRLPAAGLWDVFIRAYQAERPITEEEKRCFPDVYAILGTVYYSKLLNYWMLTGREELARMKYPYLLELLETGEEPAGKGAAGTHELGILPADVF